MIKNKIYTKNISLIFCIFVFLIIISITTSKGTINTRNENTNENQGILGDPFTGFLIGKISNLHRFSNKDYIICQAVFVYYNGGVIIRPPHVIDELKGWLFSDEIKILRPYIGIITRNFICAFVAADSDIFYSNPSIIQLN